jgi:hypothetical protein
VTDRFVSSMSATERALPAVKANVVSSSVLTALGAASVGASSTGVPVIAFEPVTSAAIPSLTLVAIVKPALKFGAGVNVTPASSTLTSAIGPLAVHTPVPPVYTDVTVPDVSVLRLPAAGSLSVRVMVTLVLSTSLTTMSTRSSGVSSV